MLVSRRQFLGLLATLGVGLSVFPLLGWRPRTRPEPPPTTPTPLWRLGSPYRPGEDGLTSYRRRSWEAVQTDLVHFHMLPPWRDRFVWEA